MKPRRWFRFSLRTLLAGFLLIAVSMGWVTAQLKWRRDRHRAIEWVQATTPYGISFQYSTGSQAVPVRAPWFLSLLGEESCTRIRVNTEAANPEKVKELKSLFPEAEVSVSTKEEFDREGEKILEEIRQRRAKYGPGQY